MYLHKINTDKIKNEIVLNDNNDIEWETERPQFDDFCNTCSLAINYTYPIKIIDKWDIRTCACTDSDTE